MRDALLIALLALIGAERIDLLGGTGPFLLTPLLVLAPVVIAMETIRIVSRRGRLRLPPNAAGYFLVVTSLFSLVLVSIGLSDDVAMSARRGALLFVQIYAGFLVAIALANRDDPRALLVRGAYAGLAVHLVFNLVQLGVWLSGIEGYGFEDDSLYLEPGTYFGVIPRLTGGSMDPNQGGLLALIYVFILLRFGRPSRLRSAAVAVGVLSIGMTLSRSAVLAGLGVGGFQFVRWLRLRVSPAGLVGGLAVAAALLGALVLRPELMGPLEEPVRVLGNRLTLAEGSSSEHLEVLQRGFEVGTENVKQALFGIGYGNAYTRLQDIFPDNKYGNFHSLFVTLFAEVGVLASALGVLLYGYPLLRRGAFQPLFAGLVLYNLFQQSLSDPMVWLILALAWTRVCDEPGREEAAVPEVVRSRPLRPASAAAAG